jgi:hypothetical protein
MPAEKADRVSSGFSTDKDTNNKFQDFQVRLLSGHKLTLFNHDGRDILFCLNQINSPPLFVHLSGVGKATACELICPHAASKEERNIRRKIFFATFYR